MYQKVIIAGHVGNEVSMRYTQDGTPVTNFSMATNESWTDDSGEKQERTTWWRVSAWRRLAEVCNEYLGKGSKVLVEGRMNPDPDTGGPRIYEKNDGSSGASFELTAARVVFLGSQGDGNGGRSAPREKGVPAEVAEDSIPF